MDYDPEGKRVMSQRLYKVLGDIGVNKERMDFDPEGKRVMSQRLYKVLGDIGVNKEVIIIRRKTWLTIEKLAVSSSLMGDTIPRFFYFGSQSEGTTTLEMKSDIDGLYTDNKTNIIFELSEWLPGVNNLLVLKNEHSPPQHCNLQVISPVIPLPITRNMLIGYDIKETEFDKEGRLLFKNDGHGAIAKRLMGKLYIKKGPSRSFRKDIDSVFASSCIRRPEECMFLFRRPRPGHWPTPATLAKARHTATHLVPQGHPESSCQRLEWRFSTPLIERLVMFDLNMIQLKVYAFLKILRKTYFKPDFDDRLSTFHIKTAMMFTLECYPPDIWKRNNLLQCVIYCLTTLKRWCRMHYCPHYTISGVDLFVGKLFKFELPRILRMLSDMIENIGKYVVHIQMDQLGERMLTGTKLNIVNLSTRFENILNIHRICLRFLLMYTFSLEPVFSTSKNDSASTLIMNCKTMIRTCKAYINGTEPEFTKDTLFMLLNAYKSLLVSVKASARIESHQNVTEEIIDQYQVSMDVPSGRLKFASMLYCTGKYEKAAAVLEHTEELLHPDVWQFSLRDEHVRFRPRHDLLKNALDLPFSEIVKTFVAPSVRFFRQELHCVPKHLVYEMYRTFTPADVDQRAFNDMYMNNACIESVPFLYYLQYLTYRELGQHDKKRAAGKKLVQHLNDERNRYGYVETSVNMLGHYYELENRLDLSGQCYSISLRMFPCNNAARWHKAIMITKLINQTIN